jgi:hypothetical protein
LKGKSARNEGGFLFENTKLKASPTPHPPIRMGGLLSYLLSFLRVHLRLTQRCPVLFGPSAPPPPRPKKTHLWVSQRPTGGSGSALEETASTWESSLAVLCVYTIQLNCSHQLVCTVCTLYGMYSVYIVQCVHCTVCTVCTLYSSVYILHCTVSTLYNLSGFIAWPKPKHIHLYLSWIRQNVDFIFN